MSFYYRIFSKIYSRSAKRMCKECADFIKNGSSILDIGCGSGIIAQGFQKFFQADVVGVDIKDQRVFPIKFQIIDGSHLPFLDNSFDIVLINYVLHHSKNPTALLKEAKRVVKDKVIIYEDLPEGFFPKLFCQIHGNIFDIFFKNSNKTSFNTEEEWKEIFNKIGLNIIFRKKINIFPAKQELFVLGA